MKYLQRLKQKIINELFLYLSRHATVASQQEIDLCTQLHRQNKIIAELLEEPKVFRPNPRSYPYPPSF